MPLSLLDLPEELLTWTASVTYPSSLLTFALGCRTLYRCSKQALEEQQKLSVEYRVCHDRLPLTIPSLLRLVTSAPHVAWHVRGLEFWGVRPDFAKWKTWSWTHQNPSYNEEKGEVDPNWPDRVEDRSFLDSSFFSYDELDEYARIVQDELKMDSARADAWMAKFREGSDDHLKVLLISQLPRINRLNFIAYISIVPAFDVTLV